MSEPLSFQEGLLLTRLASDLAIGHPLDDADREALSELADRAAVQTQMLGNLTEELEALLELVRPRADPFEARRDELIAKTVATSWEARR